MKRIFLVLLLLVLVGLTGLPFEEYPTARLLPVKTIQVLGEEGVEVLTEVGRGLGQTWELALEDLKQRAGGRVFFDTAEHIVFCGRARLLLPRVARSGALRPGTRVYFAPGPEDPNSLGPRLDAHPSGRLLGREELQ